MHLKWPLRKSPAGTVQLPMLLFDATATISVRKRLLASTTSSLPTMFDYAFNSSLARTSNKHGSASGEDPETFSESTNLRCSVISKYIFTVAKIPVQLSSVISSALRNFGARSIIHYTEICAGLSTILVPELSFHAPSTHSSGGMRGMLFIAVVHHR